MRDIFATIGLFATVWAIAKVIDAKITLYNQEYRCYLNDIECQGCPDCEFDWR